MIDSRSDVLLAKGQRPVGVIDPLAQLVSRLLPSQDSASWLLLRSYWPLYGFVFLVGTENYVVSPFLPAMAHDFDRSIPVMAALVAAYSITYAVAAPVLGSISDWVGSRYLIIVGGIAFLIGNSLMAAASSFEMLLVGRTVTGLGGAAAGPAIWAFIGNATAPKWRGRAMGLGMGAFSMGQIVGIPLGGFVASLSTWRDAFGGIALLVFPLMLAAFLLSRRPEVQRSAQEAKSIRLPLFSVWRGDGVRMILLTTFLFQAGNLASYAYLGSLFASDFHLSTAQMGMSGILVGMGTLLGSFAGGKLNDHWLSKSRNVAQLTIGWALLLGASILVTTSHHSPVISFLALPFWFFASGAFVTTQLTMLTLAAPRAKATAVSWNNSVMHAGAGFGVWLIGIGLDHGLPVGFIGLACAVAAAASAFALTRICSVEADQDSIQIQSTEKA